MLPGGPSLPKLVALVRGYVGDELVWDLRLVLAERIEGVISQENSQWVATLQKSGQANPAK